MLALAGCSQPQPTRGPIPEVAAASITETPAPAGEVIAEDATPTPLSTVLAVASSTPTREPTATRTPIPCDDLYGAMVTDSFVSELTGEQFRYRVYLPPCYTTTARRYPVLYMLHGLGWNMDDLQWDRLGIDEAANAGYAQGALPPMIIVMPNGNDADYGASIGISDFPEVVVQELIPRIDSQYCTWAEPEARAIGGLSRGGYWAYWIAFTHPELFDRVGGHSPYFYDPIYPDEQNPFNVVDSALGVEHLEMYFDHGGRGRDQFEVMPGVQRFVERLDARGIESTYIVNEFGDHIEEYWAEHTPEYLTFYAEDWPRDVEAFPSCHAGG